MTLDQTLLVSLLTWFGRVDEYEAAGHEVDSRKSDVERFIRHFIQRTENSQSHESCVVAHVFLRIQQGRVPDLTDFFDHSLCNTATTSLVYERTITHVAGKDVELNAT